MTKQYEPPRLVDIGDLRELTAAKPLGPVVTAAGARKLNGGNGSSSSSETATGFTDLTIST